LLTSRHCANFILHSAVLPASFAACSPVLRLVVTILLPLGCDVSSAKVSWWLRTLAGICICVCRLQFVCMCEIFGATKRTLLCCFLSLRVLFLFFVVFVQFSASAFCCCCGFNGGNGWFMCRSSSLQSPVHSLQSSVPESSDFSQCAMAKDNAV